MAKDSKKGGGAKGWSEVEELLKRVPAEQLAKGAGISEDTLRKYRYQGVSQQVLKALETSAAYYELRQQRTGDVSVLRDVGAPYRVRVRRLVPVVGFVAGADVLSTRAFNYSDLAEQIEEEMETDSKDPNALGLIVEGDSMEPEYQPGDRIVVAPNAEPRNKDVVVARLVETGATVLKRFFRTGPEGKTVRLESTNKNYEDIVKPFEAFRFIYPVVDMRRTPRR